MSNLRIAASLLVFVLIVYSLFSMVSATFPEFGIENPIPEPDTLGRPLENTFNFGTNPPACSWAGITECFNVPIYWLTQIFGVIGASLGFLGSVVFGIGNIVFGILSFSVPVLADAPFPFDMFDVALRIVLWLAVALLMFALITKILGAISGAA